METVTVKASGNAVVFEVRVAPRASRAQVLGVHGNALKVALLAPPVDGAANAALVELLAELLSVPKRAVVIVRGDKSRTKTLRIEGTTAAAVQALVGATP